MRTRALRVLRAVGVPPRFLYRRLGWQPEMPMTAIPHDEIVAVVESSGGRVLEATPETTDPGGVISRVYLIAPAAGAMA